MNNNTEQNARIRLFGVRTTEAEHTLFHGASRVLGYDSASEWARAILLREARDAFRSTLRQANEAREAARDGVWT